MKIKRKNIPLSDFRLYYEGDEITSEFPVEYGDFIDVYFKYDGTGSPFLLNEYINVPLAIASASTEEIYSYATMNYVSKQDRLAPDTHQNGYYYARFKVPDLLGLVDLTFITQGTPIVNKSREKKKISLQSILPDFFLDRQTLINPRHNLFYMLSNLF